MNKKLNKEEVHFLLIHLLFTENNNNHKSQVIEIYLDSVNFSYIVGVRHSTVFKRKCRVHLRQLNISLAVTSCDLGKYTKNAF